MKYRILFLSLVAALAAGCGEKVAAPAVSETSVAPYAAFGEGLLPDITPQGWIRTFLERQRTGITGHPEALSYPYDSCLWDGDITRNTESYGSDWWRYEQTAYYTDGLVKLGYLLDDQDLIAKGEAGIRYTLEHADSTGRLPHTDFTWARMWPMAVFFRAIKAYAEEHGDGDIPAALARNFACYSDEELSVWRNIVNIEGMLWTYDQGADSTLLERAERLWNGGAFGDLTPEVCLMDEFPMIHGVTFNEELKLPVMLYAHTGKKAYLDAALKAYSTLEQQHMLPDGVNTSAERLFPNDINSSHETCDIADYTWTLGYFLEATGEGLWADRIERAVFNALPGAVTKDFKTLQYFSSVNQTIATGDSNHNEFFFGSTWMAYRPTHQTECCAGAVHRVMPNYASRMWMRGAGGAVVAALYGPSSVTVALPSGQACAIDEKTAYPFGETIDFQFHMARRERFPFVVRIPSWCSQPAITINGKPFEAELLPGSFVTIDRAFRSGDVVSVSLPMAVIREHVPMGGSCFYRGPLLYAYPVPQKVEADEKEYDNMAGKVPGNPDFKCLSITPAGPWNYAITGGATEWLPQASEGYPLDMQTVTGKIRIPVKEIEWNLWQDRFTPSVPREPKALSDETKYIELVPYGATELRISVFPELLGE
ncbi:MAG: glycoside hydrolase family 127 protein [Bacteroidales bacterium]|nr:glycoside hydrolase family 127 protein [Bacteroidales bacterium]